MASAQTRVADTIEVFYTASDRTSEGALAANAYKRAVEDLDHSITRELARVLPPPLNRPLTVMFLGRSVPDDDYGTYRQAQRALPHRQRPHQ